VYLSVFKNFRQFEEGSMQQASVLPDACHQDSSAINNLILSNLGSLI